MKLAIVILAVVGVSMACDTKKDRDEFDAFRRTYRKSYKDTAEEDYRCTVFSENYAKIEAHNERQARGLEGYTMEINKYSDYTFDEFTKLFTGLRPELEQKSRIDFTKRTVKSYDPNFKAPASVNWVTQGFVTPVKNQGKCGSCWSFASIAVTESRWMIKYGIPFGFQDWSEQSPLECSEAYGNAKCNGGLMTNTYRYWLTENHGTIREEDYPYISADGNNGSKCHYDHSQHKHRITGFTEIDRADDAALEQAIAQGPVAVAVKVVDSMQNYKSGIYAPITESIIMTTSECGSGSLVLGLNHAVLAVGYTADWWLIKNSWGEGWGEAGYIRIARKTPKGKDIKNHCGISSMASFPLV